MTLIDTIKRHEGFRAKPYQCTSGVWTFGYGFTSITTAEANLVLDLKVKKLQETLSSAIKNLSQSRQDVLINMAYNLGIDGLMKFRKMWLAIHDKDFDRAAYEMLNSRWAKQVGNRAIELSDAMRKGE